MAVDPAYLKAVSDASKKYGVPAELLAAQIQAESGWNKDAKSPAGATGISQFMPGTAKGFHIDPSDPFQSIDAQGKMMSNLLNQFGGDVDKALAGYNAGAGAVKKYGGVPPYKETQGYIKRIKEYEKNYPGLASGNPKGVTAQTQTGSVTGTDPKAPVTPSNGSSQSVGATDPDAAHIAQRRSQLPLIAQLMQRTGVSNPGLTMLADFQAKGMSTAALTGAAPANAPGTNIPLTTTNDPGNPSSPAVPGSTNPTDLAKQVAGPQAAKVVGLAQQYLGTPYKWGGADPKNGFDCSGFAQFLYKKNGVNIPRTTFEQVKSGVGVDRKELQPGDLVFFNTAGANSHEGIYLGDGKFIHAPHTGDVVKISNLNDPYYTKHFSTARRVTGNAS